MLRFGIHGFGNIGRTHLKTLTSDLVPAASVSALVARQGADLPADVARYDTLDELLSDDQVDAVIVATPTHDHVAAGLKVLQAGKHLLMEKPIAPSVGQARALLQACTPGLCAAVMLNQRHHPAYRHIKSLLGQAELGTLRRFSWMMTAWYRPDIYYQVSAWRGTWPGEGGGALLNQCIHNLDVLQWLLGMPDSIVAQASYGKFHDIDVEDEVSALFSYGRSGEAVDALSGVLVASTGEAPGINRLDIVGDEGSLSFDGQTLTLQRADEPISRHCAETRDMFGVPVFTTEEQVPETGGNQHAAIFNNFTDAVLNGADLETPLATGLDSLALANAILLSDWQDKRVHLPLDEAAYETELTARTSASALRTPKDIPVNIDMDKSYR